jgi:hypothetical protein
MYDASADEPYEHKYFTAYADEIDVRYAGCEPVWASGDEPVQDGSPLFTETEYEARCRELVHALGHETCEAVG